MTMFSLTARARDTLRIVHRTDGLSRSSLIRETGLSGTAIFRATEELEAAGLIEIGDAVAQGRGQPSAMIHVRADAVFSLGLSVMTDRADVLLLDLAGQVRAQREITVAGMPRASILDSVVAFAREAVATLAVPYARIAGLGVAIAGYFVEADAINPGFELDDWALIDLRHAVHDHVGLPVMIDNIANAAAVGERLLGAGSRLDSFAYVNVAAGFGSGLIVDGHLMRGRIGNAGEIAGLFALFGRATPNLVTLKDMLERHGVPCASISDLVFRFDPAWPGVDQWVAEHHEGYSQLFTALRYTLDCDAVILGGRLPRSLAERIVSLAAWPEASQPPRRGRAAPSPELLVAALSPELSAPLGAASLILSRDVLG